MRKVGKEEIYMQNISPYSTSATQHERKYIEEGLSVFFVCYVETGETDSVVSILCVMHRSLEWINERQVPKVLDTHSSTSE